MKIKLLSILLGIVLVSCEGEVLPKPKGFLRLEYPEQSYQKVLSGCPYTLEISQLSMIDFENNCWAKINYPALDASIHLTYRRVNNDLEDVLKEVDRLTFEHAIKADRIDKSALYENKEKRVFGEIVNVEGDVASNIQFHVTDSIHNVLYGSLYFNVKPNYDSIYPAIRYIEKDIANLIEHVEWKD